MTSKMKIKENDFIEIDYTGKDEQGRVFDTTVSQDAPDSYSKKALKPRIICLGQRQLIKGLDEALVHKEIGSYKFTVEPDKAFGKKEAKHLKLMPMSLFKKQKIQPYKGLDVNIDGHIGTVRSVSGGRVIVDFNHPLAGQKVNYSVTVLRKVTDKKEQIESLLKILNIQAKKISVENENNKGTITLDKPLHPKLAQILKVQIQDLIKVDVKIDAPEYKSSEEADK